MKVSYTFIHKEMKSAHEKEHFTNAIRFKFVRQVQLNASFMTMAEPWLNAM